MQRKKLTLPMFLVVLVIFLVNGGLTTAKLITDGANFQSILPVVCWFLAAIFWTIAYLRLKDKNYDRTDPENQ